MKYLAILLVVPFLVGCALGPAPLQGIIYSDIKYPSYYDGADTLGPGAKIGKAEAMSVMMLVSLGDASVDAACKNGGVQKIHTVDHHYWSILGILNRWTTIVTGS